MFQCDAKDVELHEGNIVCLTTDPDYEEFVTEDTIFVDYRKASQVVAPGSRILIDCVEGGQVRLSALEIGNAQLILITPQNNFYSMYSKMFEDLGTIISS